MSMPIFPDSGLDITRDQALNMILTSIAMEELALSHILNAEGEKIQYMLGTLPGQHCTSVGTQDILKVNQSVTTLLEGVMQNQIILKGKMEKVLESKQDYPPHPPIEPCREICRSSMQLSYEAQCSVCKNCGGLPWQTACQCGCSIQWKECDPAVIRLQAGKQYWLSYIFQLRALTCKKECGSIVIQPLLHNPCTVLPCYHFCLDTPDQQTVTCSTLIAPQACEDQFFPIVIALEYSGYLFVDGATLSIMEI